MTIIDVEERPDDGVNEDGFMPHCEVIVKEKPQFDVDDENVREDPDPKFFEYVPDPSPEGDECEPLHFVSREEWGALPPIDPVPIEHFPLKYVVYTMSTRRESCQSREECGGVMRRMQKRHMDAGMSDIAYNFCVGRDGTVYEGRGWKTKSAKKLKYNPALYGRRIDIGFIGDFVCQVIPPIDMLEGAQNLQRLGIEEKYLIDGHKMVMIQTDYKRIKETRRTGQFPTAEQWLYDKEEPPDEFELDPVYLPKQNWKGV